MGRSLNTGIWIIATGVIIALLYVGREIFAPFALAVFLFLIVEGFARFIDERLSLLNRAWARGVAILVVIGGFIGDRFGRKTAMFVGAGIVIPSVFLPAFLPPSYEVYLFFRYVFRCLCMFSLQNKKTKGKYQSLAHKRK